MGEALDPLDGDLVTLGEGPVLDRAAEADRGRLLRTGGPRADAARQILLRSMAPLVVGIARRYTGRGLSLEDLLVAGRLGLDEAVDRFDPDRGYRLGTYASWWVRSAITRALQRAVDRRPSEG